MGVEDILSKNPPGIFRFVTLPLEIPKKTSFNGESKRNKTNNERQNHQIRNKIDK